jgi:hypothetical protein
MATLRTLMLQTLAEGRPITAGGMSKLWGEDKHRCQEWLEKFCKMGLAKRRAIRTSGNCRKSRERGDVPLYAPNVPAIMAELAGNP